MTPKHERLADAIEDRRGELGLSLREVAQLAKITGETLRAVRKGANDPSALTKRGIERALQWAPGSVDSVLAGGRPRAARAPRSPMDEAEAIMDENERLAAQLVERVMRLNRRKREAVEQMIEALEDDPPASTEPH